MSTMTMCMSGVTMTTTDIGYAKNKEYASGVSRNQPRKHAVVKDERNVWITQCTRKPATREYKGWVNTLTCKACQKIMEASK